MSEETTTETVETADAPPPAADPPADPNWLPERIEQVKRSTTKAILSDLGVEDAETVKAQLAELKELKDAQLSEQERVNARLAELEPAAQRATALETTVKAYAEREMSALTESQQNAVKALAGEDASRVLGAIEALKPTWAAIPAPPPAPPQDTTASSGPPDTGATSNVDAMAEFKQTDDPFARSKIVAFRLPELVKA